MSMSSHVVGIKPTGETYNKMLAIYRECEKAGVEAPEVVQKYFEPEEPDPGGIVVDLDEHEAVKKWDSDMSQGYEVEIAKLPSDIKVLRFFNSW